MIPRRNRNLPFGRNSFLFSYKRRYNGNLCARSVQQAKAAASMMTCTLSAPAAYFLSTMVLCARNVSPTAYFLPTAAKSMKKCRQKPMVSGLPFLSRVAFVMGRKGDRLCNKPAAAPSQVKGRVGLPPWQSVPHGRTANFFNCPRSGSESRSKPIPCFGGI